MQVLTGHDSVETAYLIESYPYGGLRCQMKCWIETNGKKGQRYVTQTQNPKTLRWNKPKMSTYADLMVMFLDDKGHVHQDSISLTYSDEPKWNEFVAKYSAGMIGKYREDLLKVAPIVFERRKHMKWTITPGPIERIV